MKEAEMAIPHLFMCPISLDLFKDPVTLCTGQTYDRSSIERWLAAGNLTCPVTMQELHDLSMVPNHTLRHLIDQWLQLGPQFNPDYLANIDSLASFKHKLESREVSLDVKVGILERIRGLCAESSQMKYGLVQLGFLPLILELVFGRVESVMYIENLTAASSAQHQYVLFVEKSLVCVLDMLSLGEHESLNVLNDESKVESFSIVFNEGTAMIKRSLCDLVEIISSSVETRELSARLGNNHGFLCGLVALVHQNREESDCGVKAIAALCSLESNRENMVQAGGVSVLLAYISNTDRHERRLAPIALATIELLLELESTKQALIQNPDGIQALVKMIFRVSDHEGSESAIRSLMILCRESLQIHEQAISAGVLTQLLLLLQSQCSSRTKTEARTLLKMLRST